MMAYGSEQRNRHFFRWLLVAASTAALASGCVLDRSGLQGGSGGAGGASTCVSGSECPDDDPCGIPACINSACGYTPEPVGTVCSDAMDRICNAVGQCVAPEAYPCADDPNVCPDGFPCVDGVCCNNSCEGPCEACNLSDTAGICTPLLGGSNPNGVCTEGVCDGGGDCAVGAQQWQHMIAATGEQYFLDMATGPDGSVYLVGAFTVTMPLPGVTPLTPIGTRNGVLVKLNAAGQYQWHQQFEFELGVVSGVDVRGSEVFVTGWFNTNMTVNGQGYSGVAEDIFVAKLTDGGSTGTLNWLETFGGTSSDYSRRLTVTGDGEVVVTGRNTGGMFGVEADIFQNLGNDDAFLLKLDNDGAPEWFRWFGGPGDQTIWGLDSNDEGELLLSGMTDATFDAGSGDLVHIAAKDIWAAQISASGGTQWSRLYGGPGNDEARVARFGRGDDMWIGGSFDTAITLGNLRMTTVDKLEGFFVELNSGGIPIRGIHFGADNDDDELWEAELTANGGWVLGGSHERELALPLAADFMDNGGGYDAFIIKFSPELTPLWAHAISSAGQADYIQALAIDPDNNVLVTSTPFGNFDWFGQQQNFVNGTDCFVAKLSP